jgi:hypothetical protein
MSGIRVGAMLSATADGLCNFLGFGVKTEEVPPSEVSDFHFKHQITNPKITLDSGDVVWGMQCWWGDESRFREKLSKYKTINLVKIDGSLLQENYAL